MSWEPDPTPVQTGLLLKVRGGSGQGFGPAASSLITGGQVLLELDAAGDGGMGAAAAGPATWVRTPGAGAAWDEAHGLARRGFAAGGGEVIAAEPEFEQQWVGGPPVQGCVAEARNADGGKPLGPHDRWHLDDAFSGLRAARAAVDPAALAAVRIAHLDTGYWPAHTETPATLDHAAEVSFVTEDPAPGVPRPRGAEDVTPPGGLPMTRNRGHGTGTLALLAGPNYGGATGAGVVPIRIANSVVRFKTGTMAQGFAHALANKADVLSMSMGGLASQILADVINRCYEAGLVMVTAAGNNFGGLPIGSVVYPARMRRVIAACGVMADGKPYLHLPISTMQGCAGPHAKMDTALSAFTPNVPWARIGCPATVDEDGQGTSCATPQIAAAAALWIAARRAELAPLEPWRRGEAVRRALLLSAARGANVDDELGHGALRAQALPALHVSDLGPLTRQPSADASWAWLKLLTGQGVGVAASAQAAAERLLALELAQLHQLDPAVAAAVPDPDSDPGAKGRRALLARAEASPMASQALKAAIRNALGGQRRVARLKPPPPPLAPATSAVRTSRVRPPARRRLRVFALDPSLGKSLKSFEDQIATVEVRNEPDLQPGPVGEYLEVVDVDPASDRFYPPVDLTDPNITLQDGLDPSEGDPAFHQQMTYAVAMRTLDSFEEALGRKAMWAPHRPSLRIGSPNVFVPRLRIYPHAFRGDNAYYSPDRKALLFGYFPSSSKVSDSTPPGTMVFSCLSADIIAHETTHALLDGQSRGYREPSNPDVRAFHEAFADIVALFQQYGYRDLVRREIGRRRGDLSAAGLLGGLARQFGEGTGKSGPLRSYPQLPAGVSYESTLEVHARGAILVSAVYEAFLGIVERRTGDLIRLATGGSGILPAGALMPDLIDRLTDETCRAARHVLRMCIRAIDYCPPVDITFGEFLRALITADLEQVPEDRYGYRVAFLEAFRRLQLLPRSLRTVSVETLQWRRWSAAQPAWLPEAVNAMGIDLTRTRGRPELFEVGERRRRAFRKAMLTGLRSQADCDPFGLQHALGYYRSLGARPHLGPTTFMIDNPRVAARVKPDGSLAVELIVVVRQQRPERLETADADPAAREESSGREDDVPDDGRTDAGRFWFRGGATLVIDPLAAGGAGIRHAVTKPITSAERLTRERAFRLADGTGSTRAAYFGRAGDRGSDFAAREPFAMIHATRGRS